MWGSDSSYFSMRMSLPVNRIKSKNKWKYWIINISSFLPSICLLTELNAETVCGFICLSTDFTQETIWTNEHLIIKRCQSVCGGLNFCVPVCGSIRLWTEFNQETNGTVKHQSSKRFMSICGGLYLSLSVFGSYRLWTEFNQETIRTVEHQILQAIPISMSWSFSFFFSVWIHPPVITF